MESNETLVSLRNMYTASPVTYALLSMLLGGLVCNKFKRKSWSTKSIILSLYAAVLANEILYSTTNKEENVFQLLQLNKYHSKLDFTQKIDYLKEKYHPDNEETGNPDLYSKLAELSEGFKTDFSKKIELYSWYGDQVDLTSKKAIYEDDETGLQVEKGIEYLANYLMIFLISLLFYHNSASRGLLAKLLLAGGFSLFFITEMIIGNDELPDPADDSSFSLTLLLRDALDLPFATITELRSYWRLVLVFFLSVNYCYGILFNLKTEDYLMISLNNYYLKLHDVSKKVKEQQREHRDIQELEEKMGRVEDHVIEFVTETEKSEGFFKTISKIQTYIYYGIIAIVILYHLSSKVPKHAK